MFSILIASIAIASPPPLPYPGETGGFISTSAPCVTTGLLVTTYEAVIELPNGDILEVPVGWPIFPGEVLLDGSAIMVSDSTADLWDAGDPNLKYPLPAGVTLIVGSPAPAPSPSPGLPPTTTPGYSCTVQCPSGRACCWFGSQYPFCACLTPQQFQQATCHSGGISATSCSLWMPVLPPTTPTPPNPPPPRED